MPETTSGQDKADNKSLTKQERYWLGHYKCWQQSGLSVAAYTRHQGLMAKTFYNWHSKLKQRNLVRVEPIRTVFHRVIVKKTEGLPEIGNEVVSLRFHLPNGIACEVADLKVNQFADLLTTLSYLRL